MNQPARIVLLSSLLTLSFASSALAAETLSLSGAFSDAVGGPGLIVSYCGGTGQPSCGAGDPIQVRWGEPAGGNGQSGLGFDGVSALNVPSTPFLIGSLTHYNFPIFSGTAASEVDLRMNVQVVSNGTNVIFNEIIAVQLAIDETPNSEPCFYPSAAPCADRVFLAGGSAANTFTNTIGNVAYVLTIQGFSDSPTGGGNAVDDFISDEGGSTTAYMFATFSAEVLIVADAGPDQIVAEGSGVTLDGSASVGVNLNYTWEQIDGPPVTLDDPTSVMPTFLAPSVAADTSVTFRLTIDDGTYDDSDTVTIFIVNVNSPPDCTQATPSLSMLWPPNHRRVPIAINGVSDPDGDAVTLTITGIFQDEHVNNRADGTFGPDAGCLDASCEAGVGDLAVWVRAERSGRGNGRVYTILFSASDGTDSCTGGGVLVGVPHDQAHRPIDDGALYDSTEGPVVGPKNDAPWTAGNSGKVPGGHSK